MLKNIEKMQKKGLPLPKNWLRPEIYSVGIPPAILKDLNLKNPNEKKLRKKSPISSPFVSEKVSKKNADSVNASIGEISMNKVNRTKSIEP